MVKVQVTVTPNEAKRLIAMAVVQMPVVRAALDNGKVLIKGGTTTSAILEELASVPLSIAGRITQQGTLTKVTEAGSGRILVEGGQVKKIDADAVADEVVVQMGKKDVFIIGANALDIDRKAALMIAHPTGGVVGRHISALFARGVTTIIAVGWEKLIPNTIAEALAASGRETTDMAMGAAVGLIPLFGTVVTETDAVSMLTGVKATMIGAGGVLGGEGSSTFVMDGQPAQVKAAWEIVSSVKGASVSGEPESLVTCHPGCPRCAQFTTIGGHRLVVHRNCVYRDTKLPKKLFRGE